MSTGHLIDDAMAALYKGWSSAQRGDALDKLFAASKGPRDKCPIIHLVGIYSAECLLWFYADDPCHDPVQMERSRVGALGAVSVHLNSATEGEISSSRYKRSASGFEALLVGEAKN